jgi:hypothetical protein
MNRQVQLLQTENEELRDVLDQQKRITEHREGEIASLMEENDRLKTRIRKNRDHIAPFLPYLEQMSEQSSPRSVVGTPYHATPRNRGHGRAPPVPRNESNRGQQPFEALLLADKMLSQETATAPSTPTRSQPSKARFGHNRGTHSMSSLPQTPTRPRSNQLYGAVPRTPPTFSAINVPQSAPPAHFQPKPAHGRRESSNSTITASSVDEEEAFTDKEDQEVPESQASQMATTMLRKAKKAKTQASVPSSQSSSSLVQSKLYGQVKKSGVNRPGEFEKRRLQSSDHNGSPTKRGRLGEGVGLGIGGLLRQ